MVYIICAWHNVQDWEITGVYETYAEAAKQAVTISAYSYKVQIRDYKINTPYWNMMMDQFYNAEPKEENKTQWSLF